MINGSTFRDAIISAARNVSNNRKDIDALNVFPVPDGDTGTNMSMTISSARKELERLPDDVPVSKVAAKTSSAMLRGARGTSGVILSLIFRGISKGLKGYEEIGPREMILALSYGVESAYKAVMKPTEGTILTVVRLACRAGAEFGTENKEADFAEVWAHVIDGAKEALAQTPEMLPVLKKAGVVDAGGQGLVTVFEVMQSVFRDGKIIEDLSEAGESAPQQTVAAPAAAALKHAYCTEYLVIRDTTCKRDPLSLQAYLESIGDELTVETDGEFIKVHVHTNEPGRALNEGKKYGALVKVQIRNMEQVGADTGSDPRFAKIDLHKFHRDPVKEGESTGEATDSGVAADKLAPVEPVNEYGFVAVAAGDGISELFKEIGADVVVSGGQTMNPSTEDILNAVEATPAHTVFVLPNNKNIIMAAEQVDPISSRKVIVIPTRTIPQGVTAMLHFNPDEPVKANHLSMTRALDGVDTAQVTFAARDSVMEGFNLKKGQMLGMENGAITVVEDDAITAAYKVTRHLCSRHTEMVTIFYGEGATEEEAMKLEKMIKDRFSSIETSVLYGGQPVYSYIISVE
ncbi:MAG: DAK2 domain-containing protein [Clostridia bacterium]|nr:DAK2 domain-containing protein [Clostridia bacterium]